MTEEQMIQKARKLAAERYKKGEFLCAEAVLYTINELLEKPFPDEIVKLASGFPAGIGESGCVCGAISGGVMALGLVFGRTEPGKKCPKIYPAARELHDWFKKNYKSTCCRVLTRNFKFGSKEHIKQCIEITGDVAGKTMELIFKYQKTGRLKLLFKKLG
ncbi:hypothetical protein BBF96_15675 [Anoxybacter fermentans]|uniref:C_GCAxxG_C_C family protein n=1 Tax=Anoxybacter fermentans TaxID=1323375 RepID=A0A3Q9HSD3_9FIRM|nr:C-GCAxxG-C-C family protein [Anoxybacter fermentans]AZR74681.1 hypothetical protein BBF96_15675 [Anoxybacter fermentans]